MPGNNWRIAKNTLLLYFRMIFMMLVSLYTSRVVLNTLGVEDYGIYNVVGGVVAMFSFINGAMSTSTQRYLTFELGRGDAKSLNKVFCTSVIIHALLSVLIVVLAETIGLWFFYYEMVIPKERLSSAMWVYQFSVLASVAMIMSVPYNATIVAHERMSAFAYISVLEAILKLLIVYLLQIGDADRLVLYAILILAVQLGIRMIYNIYCNRHFEETKFHWQWDKTLFREMLGFAGWNLWGCSASAAFTHGVNLLLNTFFGPVVNAARGIAVQVQAAVSQFSINFQTAINPQIIKSYAVNDYGYMHSLIFRSSKFTFCLLLILSLPVMFETETILQLWLKTVPEHTVTFIRLMLCVTIIDSVANPLMVSAAASGRVKLYQGVVGGILLCILPISYIVLKLGGDPASVFVVHLCVCVVAFVVRLYIIRPIIKLSLREYCRCVIIPCLLVTLLSIIFPIFIKNSFSDGIFSFLVVCLSSFVCVALATYWVGLNFSERDFIRRKVRSLLSKIRP